MYLKVANLQGLGAPVGEANMFPNNLKVPYSDQFSLGIRNKVGDWNTSVTLTRINSYEGLLGVLGNRYADGSFATRGCGLDWGGSPAQWCSAGLPGLQSNLVLWENGQRTRTGELLVWPKSPTRVSRIGVPRLPIPTPTRRRTAWSRTGMASTCRTSGTIRSRSRASWRGKGWWLLAPGMAHGAWCLPAR